MWPWTKRLRGSQPGMGAARRRLKGGTNGFLAYLTDDTDVFFFFI